MTAAAALARHRSRPRQILAETLSARGLFMALLIAGLLFLIVLPVVALVLGSFLPTPPRALSVDWSGLTLGNYREILTAGGFLDLLRVTLAAAVIGTAGAMLIGSGLAWLATRTDVPGRRLLEWIAILPMFVPPLVGAFAWDILASPRSGIINIALRSFGIGAAVDIYSFGGIGFVFADLLRALCASLRCRRAAQHGPGA